MIQHILSVLQQIGFAKVLQYTMICQTPWHAIVDGLINALGMVGVIALIVRLAYVERELRRYQ